jgi:hypothetical protein
LFSRERHAVFAAALAILTVVVGLSAASAASTFPREYCSTIGRAAIAR